MMKRVNKKEKMDVRQDIDSVEMMDDLKPLAQIKSDMGPDLTVRRNVPQPQCTFSHFNSFIFIFLNKILKMLFDWLFTLILFD